MTLSGWIFMSLSWAVILWLTAFCLIKIFFPKKGKE
jgi:hypothetical protein